MTLPLKCGELLSFLRHSKYSVNVFVLLVTAVIRVFHFKTVLCTHFPQSSGKEKTLGLSLLSERPLSLLHSLISHSLCLCFVCMRVKMLAHPNPAPRCRFFFVPGGY